MTEFFWQNAAAQSLYNFVVVQLGAAIVFYQVGNATALSNELVFSFELSILPEAPGAQLNPCQFASGYGYLFIAHPSCYPVYVTYDPTTTPGNFTVNDITLFQRDFTGLDDPGLDGLDVAIRPALGNPAFNYFSHIYNLFNQGWGNTSFSLGTWNGTSVIPESADYASYVADFAPNLWPSNCDAWWTFKDEFGDYNPFSMIPVVGSIANSPAPMGHFILDTMYQDRGFAVDTDSQFTYILSGSLDGDPVSSYPNGPAVCAFFAGRVWFAGIAANNFNNQIFYSQILSSIDLVNNFYQANDPTATDLGVADLVDSDGGVLVEPAMGQIYKMQVVGYSLMIFCSNGTWAISGSSGTGFKATDFSVTKISNIALVSPNSFIDADGIPMWWNVDGIYTVSTGGSTANGASSNNIVSMTDTTIQTFFNNIPSASLPFVKGSYNRSLKTVYWLFTSGGPSDLTTAFQYDSCLCYNTLTKVFYSWTLPLNVTDGTRTGICISGIVTTEGIGTSVGLEDVTDQFGFIVVDNTGADVETEVKQFGLMPTVTHFLTQFNNAAGNPRTSFSQVNSTTYMDFVLNDFTSFATSGYSMEGQAVGRFQSPYLLFYLNTSQATQITTQVQWEFANSLTTGKIGSINLLQDEGGNYDFKAFRRKVRGTGRSMQVHFQSVTGQFFEVAGWAIEVSTNTGA